MNENDTLGLSCCCVNLLFSMGRTLILLSRVWPGWCVCVCVCIMHLCIYHAKHCIVMQLDCQDNIKQYTSLLVQQRCTFTFLVDIGVPFGLETFSLFGSWRVKARERET